MTTVICEAHRDLFANDCYAAQQAFSELERLLSLVRRQQLNAPILAIHHARLEIADILIRQSQALGMIMMRQILRDLAQQRPNISLDALRYFLDMARHALNDACFFSPTLRSEANHLLSSLTLLQELPDDLLCRALLGISTPHTLIC